jgi:hypothetical protein
MYVYIWKTPDGTPFYVGFTKSRRRPNPRNNGGRSWLCRQKLNEVGPDNVVVELRPVASLKEGIELECRLIAEIGRIQMGTGPLTNLTSGGDGTHSPTPEHREALRQAMLNPAHPARSPEARAQQRKRMNDPDIKSLFTGEANPAKRPEIRQKLKERWADPEYQQRQTISRTGVPKNFSEEELARRAEAVRSNPLMKSWADLNGKDPEFDAKRIAGIRAAQDKRREKMADPAALAQRKARLKVTMNSEEYKAKRALWDTPEHRARLSEAKKAYWAKKKDAT